MAPQMTSFEAVEFDYSNTQPTYEGSYFDMPATTDDDGTVEVTEGPSLGIDCDWVYIEENDTSNVHTYD